MGEILEAAEGELALVACLAKDGRKCEGTCTCATLPFWQGLEEQINDYVNRYTLQDLLDSKKQHTDCCGCSSEKKEDEKHE